MNAYKEEYTQNSATKLAHLIVFYLHVLKGNQATIKATSTATTQTVKKANATRIRINNWRTFDATQWQESQDKQKRTTEA